VRNGVFFFFDKNQKGMAYRIAAALLAICMVVLGVLSWQGWVSLLIIVALALNTLFMAFGTPQRLRQSVCFTSALVLAYNICVFSVGGIMNEALAIISSVVGILRYRKEKGQAAEN
jgi:predicted membrane protein